MPAREQPGGPVEQPGMPLRTALTALVTLADTPPAQRLAHVALACTHLARADAVIILVTDAEGRLVTSATSSGDADHLADIELSTGWGPATDSYNQGRALPVTLLTGPNPWPAITTAAIIAGLLTVTTHPLRSRGRPIGALALYRHSDQALSPDIHLTAQALADTTAVGIMTDRAITRHEHRADQLQEALDSRIIIEQAKGFLSANHHITPARAFTMIRSQARNTNRDIHEVAAEIVDSTPEAN